jgi:hypothetical protein
MSKNMKLVAIPTSTAQWAGMAPAVAGGWIMNCSVGDMAMDRLLATDEKLACVPDGQSYEGREIGLEKVTAALSEAVERTSRRVWSRHSVGSDLAALRGWIDRVKLLS